MSGDKESPKKKAAWRTAKQAASSAFPRRFFDSPGQDRRAKRWPGRVWVSLRSSSFMRRTEI